MLFINVRETNPLFSLAAKMQCKGSYYVYQYDAQHKNYQVDNKTANDIDVILKSFTCYFTTFLDILICAAISGV